MSTSKHNSKTSNRAHEWDLFISHASEDKESIVKPLADALSKFGLRVWYDEFTLKLGESLSRSISKGLARSKYGLVILSKAFFKKNWTTYELSGLTAREIDGSRKIILPIWHGVSRSEVLRFSPPLADKVALTSDGRSPLQLAIAVIETVRPDIFERIHRRLAFLSEPRKKIRIRADDLAVGSPRHKELPDELVGRIRLIRAALLGMYTHSMKFWVDGFRYDAHPSKEVSVWERIAAVVSEYLAMTGLEPKLQTHVFRVVLGLACGNSKAEMANDLSGLPPNAFDVLSQLINHKVPIYDVKEQEQHFHNSRDKAEIGSNEDREAFPIDVPTDLLVPLVKAGIKREKGKRAKESRFQTPGGQDF